MSNLSVHITAVGGSVCWIFDMRAWNYKHDQAMAVSLYSIGHQ